MSVKRVGGERFVLKQERMLLFKVGNFTGALIPANTTAQQTLSGD